MSSGANMFAAVITSLVVTLASFIIFFGLLVGLNGFVGSSAPTWGIGVYIIWAVLGVILASWLTFHKIPASAGFMGATVRVILFSVLGIVINLGGAFVATMVTSILHP